MTTSPNPYRAGTGAAEQFKVSGTPFLYRGKFTSGAAVEEIEITFPKITRSVTVLSEAINDSSVVIRVHFASRQSNELVVNTTDGTGANAKLRPGETISITARCSSVFISRDAGHSGVVSNYLVIGELTGLAKPYTLTGEGVDS